MLNLRHTSSAHLTQRSRGSRQATSFVTLPPQLGVTVPGHVKPGGPWTSSCKTRVATPDRPQVISQPVPEAPPATDPYPASPAEPFAWSKAWYPVASIEELDPTRPHQITLMGEDYVLWKDGSGSWRAFADRCPHRLAPLSEGRVESDGTLMCAYHAWRFDGSGQCTAIPQARDAQQEQQAKNNPRACATAYPTRTEVGVIWLWPETGAMAELAASATPIHHIQETLDDSPKVRATGWRAHELPYGLDYFFENVVDPAHVVVSHHNVAGNRYKDPKFLDIQFAKPLKADGFSFDIPSARGGLSSTTTFVPPNLVRIESRQPDGGKTILALYASPTRPGYCKHIGRQVFVQGDSGKWPPGLSVFGSPKLPTWVKHLLGNAFLNQDGVFLHWQEKIAAHNNFRDKRAVDKYYTPTTADKGVLTLRKWFERYSPQGIPYKGEFEGRALPPAERDPNKLFDTWSAHTKNCQVCLDALKQLNKARLAAWAVCAVATIQLAVVWSADAAARAGARAALGQGVTAATSASLILPPLASWVWAGVALAAAALAMGLKQLIGRFYVWPYSHADNN